MTLRTIYNNRLVDGAKLDNIVEVNPSDSPSDVEIQAGIDATPSGGKLLIRKGHYYISTNFVITNPIEIECEQGVVFDILSIAGWTTISGSGALAYPIFYINGADDLIFDGNYCKMDCNQTTHAVDVMGFFINDSDNCIVQDIIFDDYNSGICNVDSSDNIFRNLRGINPNATLFIEEGCTRTLCEIFYQDGGDEVIDANAYNHFCTYRKIYGKDATELIDINCSNNMLIEDVYSNDCTSAITLNAGSGARYTSETSNALGISGTVVRNARGSALGNFMNFKVNSDQMMKNILIEDIYVESTGATSSAFVFTNSGQTIRNTYDNLTFNNIRIVSCNRGFNIQQAFTSDYLKFSNVRIESCLRGFQVLGNHLQFNNCTVLAATDYGLLITGDNIEINNETMISCSGSYGNFITGNNVTINNAIFDTCYRGLRVTGDNVFINNLYMDGTTDYGILLEGNNIHFDGLTKNSTGAGFYLKDGENAYVNLTSIANRDGIYLDNFDDIEATVYIDSSTRYNVAYANTPENIRFTWRKFGTAGSASYFGTATNDIRTFLTQPVYADNAAALAGGLTAGDCYNTAGGALLIVV